MVKKIFTSFFILILLFLVTGCQKEMYEVQFIVMDQVIKTELVEDGNPATPPSVDEINKLDFVEGYEFIKWDVDFSNITSDLKVYAEMDSKKFTVKFYDGDNNVIDTQEVLYGDKAVIPKNKPKKLGYRLAGWDKEFDEVKTNLDIYPKFVLVNYDIFYYDGNTRLKDLTPSSYNITHDGAILLPDGPVKEGYEFLGWFEDDKPVSSILPTEVRKITLHAKYKELEKPFEIPNDATFMFKAIKKIPHSTVPDLFVYQPDFTGLDVDKSVTGYEWTSLHPNIATISQWSSISVVNPGYAIIRAKSLSKPNVVGYAVIKVNADGVFISSIEEATQIKKYTVTFTDDDGNIISTQEVEEYKQAILPTPPKKDGYTFIGWSKEHYNIKENLTLEPVYKKGNSDYSGKTVSIIGDSISTYKSYIPEGYSSFYPFPTADVKDVNQTWWMQVINNLGMKLLKNNSYAGTCVSEGTGSGATTNDDRLKETFINDVKPDIIFIYMGANDCGSEAISINTFKQSYKLMLDKVKKLSPNSKVYLINLPESKMYNEDRRVKFNNVIDEIGKEYKLDVLDIRNVFPTNSVSKYLVDSVHPNKLGMKSMSDKIIKDLLKLKGIE